VERLLTVLADEMCGLVEDVSGESCLLTRYVSVWITRMALGSDVAMNYARYVALGITDDVRYQFYGLAD